MRKGLGIFASHRDLARERAMASEPNSIEGNSTEALGSFINFPTGLSAVTGLVEQRHDATMFNGPKIMAIS
jgi:hypothetical protein